MARAVRQRESDLSPPMRVLLATAVASTILLDTCVADWLIHPLSTPATVTLAADGCELRLTNGLLQRTFAVPGVRCPAPNFATTDLTDISNADMPPKSVLAALDVEAAVELDGDRYDVGGFNNSCPRWVRTEPHVTHEEIFSTCAYLNRSQPSYTKPTANASAFRYVSHTTGSTVAPFPYERARHAADTPWPPAGIHLAVTFTAPPNAAPSIRGINVTVHYELYESIPAMTKWLTVTGALDAASVVVGNVWVESLRVNDDAAGWPYPIADGWVTGVGGRQPPSLLMRTDTSHGTGCTWVCALAPRVHPRGDDLGVPGADHGTSCVRVHVCRAPARSQRMRTIVSWSAATHRLAQMPPRAFQMRIQRTFVLARVFPVRTAVSQPVPAPQ